MFFAVVFRASRLALLTFFLPGEEEALVRFPALFFAAADVFAAADFVLRAVSGAERFGFLAAVLTEEALRLTAFFMGRFAVLAVFFAATPVLRALFVPAPLDPEVAFFVVERPDLGAFDLVAFLDAERPDGVAFFTGERLV